MVRVKPFPAVRPVPSLASRVACVPYDVVDRAEAARLAAGNRDSFLHVTRAEIDLPESVGPYDPRVYKKARENFEALLAREILRRDAAPGMYLYRLAARGRFKIGLACACHVEDYQRNAIRKHERTRPEKENDRTRHILSLGAHAEPVMAMFRDQPAFEELVRIDVNNRPLVHFVAGDGVTHTVWPVPDSRPYEEVFAGMDAVYIADGHHRAASAARAAAERRAANPRHGGDEPYNWFLAVLFPASSLVIGPYHRVVSDLQGRSPEDVLARLAELGSLSATEQPDPARPGTFGVYPGWHRLELDPDSIDHADPVRSLDVSLLQERILGPILGITDPTRDPRLEFVGGSGSAGELQRRVDEGAAAMAFCLYPTAMDQLLRVADAGLIMPPKSTWFEPKLRSGLFILVIDPGRR